MPIDKNKLKTLFGNKDTSSKESSKLTETSFPSPKKEQIKPAPQVPIDIFAEDNDEINITKPINNNSTLKISFSSNESQNIPTGQIVNGIPVVPNTIDYEEENIEDLLPQNTIKRETNTTGMTLQDMTDDIMYTLKVQQELIQKAQQNTIIALNRSADGGSARDTEVASGSIATLGNEVERLLNLYDKAKKITNQEPENNTTYVQQNIVLKGTTADALRAIKKGEL